MDKNALNILEMVEMIMNKTKEAYHNMSTFNLMVLGKTGVGKSTLINSVFLQKVADVGVGMPVTSEIKEHHIEGYPLVLFDTPGLELDGENAFNQLYSSIQQTITDRVRTGDPNRLIHCIWYCVATPSHRFEKTEMDFIIRLSQNSPNKIPVILVLTQSYSKAESKALKEEIEKQNVNIPIVPLLAEDFALDEATVVRAYGLDALLSTVEEVVPEAVKSTLYAVQKVDIEIKKEKANGIIGLYAAAAATIGAVPIPFSDAFLLVPDQIAMLANITATFGLPVNKGVLTSVISATIGTAGATILGKTVVANLLKLIPGAGKIVGGVISASVAAALTCALGETYTLILAKIVNGEVPQDVLQSEQGIQMISEIFKEKLKVKRNKNGVPIE